MFGHYCVILLLLLSLPSSVGALTSIRPSPSSGGWRSNKIKSRQNTSSTTSLDASSLSFSGDASCRLQMENASMESVSDFLQSSDSDVYLLGTSHGKLIEADTVRSKLGRKTQRKKRESNTDGQLWECKQPVVDFMGLKLQPVFVYKVRRIAFGHVEVSIVTARTEILEESRNPAKKAIASVLDFSTFSGESVFQVHPPADGMSENCVLAMDLRLTLLIQLPSYMPIPPGFNSLGSAIVRRTGRSRTKQLLDQLQEAYYQHCKENVLDASARTSISDKN